MTMRPRELLIAGSGGFARETAEVVRAINAVRPAWRLRGFLDDDPARAGAVVGGVPVLGPIELVHDHPHAAVVVCTGRPSNYTSRRAIVERLGLDPERYATLVHPLASVGATCALGGGTVALAHVVLTADVTVGRHVCLMPQDVLTHDVTVGDYATLAAAVRIGGAATVGEGAYLGSAAMLRENVTVGPWAMVGMGAVVVCDVPAERLFYGAPAVDMGPAPLPALRERVA
jgi:sugar O-acyltransferase (sialic acid O-acetyltransferase NeuD family)